MSNEKAVATTQTNAVALVPANYITSMLEATKQKFIEVNAGLELDFVRIGQWLKLNKKGQFVLRNDENVNFGDTLDAVIAKGETRYVLWGASKSPEDGQLIVAEKTEEEAAEVLTAWLEQNPSAAERYSVADIKLNFLAYVVTVSSITPDDIPDIYILSFPQTGSYSFGQYAMTVFRGMKDKGIPKNTGANAVVTRIGSKEEPGKRSDSYLALTFEAVGMFKPEEFGIKAE